MVDRIYGERSPEEFARSIELQEAALSEIPEASSSNVRGRSSYAPYPLVYMEEGDGAILTDVDGNEYIDFHGGVSAVVLGHAPPEQIEAVQAQIERGAYFATTYEAEHEAAALVNELVPNSEMVKFSSTGTEAVMSAFRLARAYTGKDKILTFEGMYHGHNDDALVNVRPDAGELGTRRNPTKIPGTGGVPESKMAAVESIPWNDSELLAEKLQREGDEIAAVITEATMSNSGLLWPHDGYLGDIRELTREHDVLFILDEVVTGFRIGLHSAQGHFDIEPDLAIYGKSLSNGYPNAALTGREDLMRFLSGSPDETTHMGTFSGNPVVGAATKANLETLKEIGTDGYDDLADRGDRLVTGLREILTDAGHDVFIPDHAGFFCIHFTDGETDPEQWSDWRDVSRHADWETVEEFAAELMGEGIFVPPAYGRINLMHAHTDEHVEEFLEAAKVAAERI